MLQFFFKFIKKQSLERALQLFLKEHLSRKKDCDFLICDEKVEFEKPQFLISKRSSQLAVPFSKAQLLQALSEFNDALQRLAEQIADEKIKALEDKIEIMAEEFRQQYQSDIDEAIGVLKDKLIKIINEKR